MIVLKVNRERQCSFNVVIAIVQLKYVQCV